MPFFLAISGYHNAGKTILALSLYETLRKKGYKIAVIKSSKEKDVLTDIPEKDTWLYREAGISAIGFFQENLFTLYLNPKMIGISSLKDWYTHFLSFFWSYDLVILESFKNLDLVHKIWVVKEDKEDLKKIKENLKNLIGFVVKENKRKWESLYPEEKFFSFDEKNELTRYVEELIEMHQPRVLLKVNKKKIPLKGFVEDILIYPLLGLVKALKGVPEEINELEIKIKLPDKLDKERI